MAGLRPPPIFQPKHIEEKHIEERMRAIKLQLEAGEVVVGLDERGEGPTVVMLPALSSISTRGEMHPLMERLAPHFRTLALDWPGFGDLAKPRADWSPALLQGFLERVLREEAPGTRAIVAAGHAACYALQAVADDASLAEKLVLIAPTWRGPFPTMVKGQRPWFSRVRAALDHPLTGPALYRANVSALVLDRMAREHVYSDPTFLVGERMSAKRAVTRAPGARHASVRFVTGALDRVDSRAAFLDLARRVRVPVLVVYGAETPRRSLAEIEALADLPGVRLEQMARGKLAVHEEFPDEVAALVAPFLAG